MAFKGFEKSLGLHVILEFYDCDTKILNNLKKLEDGLSKSAEYSGATIVSSNFHQYLPIGISGVIILKESHLAVHTWPEYNFAAIDLFTCHDSVDFDIIQKSISDLLKSSRFETKFIDRGLRKKINKE